MTVRDGATTAARAAQPGGALQERSLGWRLRRYVAGALHEHLRPGSAWDAAPRPAELRSVRGYLRGQILWRALHAEGRTMAGARRGRTLRRLAGETVRAGVSGVLVDCGSWHGASAVLMANGAPQRDVWAFDAFEALETDGGRHDAIPVGAYEAASPETLRSLFARHADPARLHVVAGWFDEVLPGAAPPDDVAMLCVGGEGHAATRLVLETFLPAMAPGGYVFVESYGHWPDVRRAVDDARVEHGIRAPLRRVDYAGAYWRHR